MDNLQNCLINHEGLKKFPYFDTNGNQTIGIGRNLTTKGLSVNECIYLMNNDMQECTQELKIYSWFCELDQVRQEVIIELCFNIGIHGVLEFQNTIKSLEQKDWESASNNLLNSEWANEVGEIRSQNMAKRLLTGSYE